MGRHEHEDFRRIVPALEGSLVRLRAIEEGDLGRINEGIWNPNVSRFLGMPGWPQPLSGTREFWERSRGNPASLVLAIETLPGELIGVCSLDDISAAARTANLGIWIAESHWNRGYGTGAVRTLCRFGFREMNLQRIGLLVHENNPRGKRAYESVGFKEEGRTRRTHFLDGALEDTFVMGLLAEDLGA